MCTLFDLFLADELLMHTKWFFSLPEQVRMSLARRAWNPCNCNVYRGYCPVIPGAVDCKEMIEFAQELPEDDVQQVKDIVFYEPNVWPPDTIEKASEFRKFVMGYYKNMSNLLIQISHLLALGLGKEESYFDSLFLHKPMSTLRLIYFPLRPGPAPDSAKTDGQTLMFMEHTDSNFATFLCTFENKGLQIQGKDGCWSDVEVRPDCLVMNAGDALVRTTGLFKATRHRVVDCGEERFSVPFFVEPSYDANIGQFAMEMRRERGDKDDDEPSLYGPWLAARMNTKNFSEFSTQQKT